MTTATRNKPRPAASRLLPGEAETQPQGMLPKPGSADE
jgi:hypothetical protein